MTSSRSGYLILIRPFRTNPQCGHWHRASGSPLNRGAVSKPPGRFSIATFISPHSAWRVTTPSPSKSTGKSCLDALMALCLLLLASDLDNRLLRDLAVLVQVEKHYGIVNLATG